MTIEDVQRTIDARLAADDARKAQEAATAAAQAKEAEDLRRYAKAGLTPGQAKFAAGLKMPG
jgi:hypothetical protein